MNNRTVRLSLWCLALGFKLTTGGFAADATQPPAGAEAGPLAPLTTNLVHHPGRNRLAPQLALALGLISEAELNRVILLPEIEADDAGNFVKCAAATRLPGRLRLILIHSEETPEGLILHAYLTSSAGILEQAAKRVNGGEYQAESPTAAAAGFERQLAYWREWRPRSEKTIIR